MGRIYYTYAAVCWNSNLFDEHSCSQVTKIPKQKTGLLKKGGRWLKVCKFRKQIFLFSYVPKNKRNHFLISARNDLKEVKSKSKGTFYVKCPLINIIKSLHFYVSTHFRSQGRNQKIISFVLWINWEQENLLLKFTDL